MSFGQRPLGNNSLIEQWLSNLTEGEAAPVILYPHYNVHIGAAFSVGGLSSGIADGAQFNAAFWNISGTHISPSGTTIALEAHSELLFSAGGQAYGYLYEGGELQSTGTLVIPTNLHRAYPHGNRSPSQWRFAYQNGIKTLGTLLGGRFLGGTTGANPNAARSVGREESGLEWDLDPEQVYILVLHNASGATVPAQIIIEYYEKE